MDTISPSVGQIGVTKMRMFLSSLKLISVRSVHTLLFLKDICVAKLSTRYSPNSHKHLLSAFYLTGGFIHKVAAKLLGDTRIEFPKDGLLSKFTKAEILDASDHLKREGYVVLEGVLSPQLCAKILAVSEQIPGQSRIMDGGTGVARKMNFNRQNPPSIRFDYEGSDLISNQVLQTLIFDESILDFAQSYLGAAPVLDLVTMWWHTTFSSIPDKEAAQWFHFDMDRLKWIKFFFYITDVDSNSGPHTFIAKSHRSLGIPYKLRSKGYARLTDQEVLSNFKSVDFKEFVGKGGTLIVEDTRGLHKGKHCISGDRLLFQLEFTTSKFGTPIPELVINPPLDQESKSFEIFNKYPTVYQSIKNL